jgi:hypothetical protein
MAKYAIQISVKYTPEPLHEYEYYDYDIDAESEEEAQAEAIRLAENTFTRNYGSYDGISVEDCYQLSDDGSEVFSP